MKPYTIIKYLSLKSKSILYYIAISILLVITVYFIINSSHKLSVLNSHKSILENRVNAFIFDNTIQEKFIGNSISFDSLYLLSNKQNSINSKAFKIIIIPDIGSCDQCYIKTLSFYDSFLSKNKLNGITGLFIVYPSSNIQYAEWAMSEFLQSNHVVYVDTTFEYSVKLGIPLSSAVVLLLDTKNTCIFAYSIDNEYPNKDILKSKIFENFMAL